MCPGMLALCPLDLVKQTTMIISNGKMKDIMKTNKSLEESGLLKQLETKKKNKQVNLLAYY